MLAALLQDLTTRTVLIAALYQSSHDACESSGEHEQIIDALEAGDVPEAARLMDAHLRHVRTRLQNLKSALARPD